MKDLKIKKFMYALHGDVHATLLHVRGFWDKLPRLKTQKSVMFCFSSKGHDVGYLECSVSIAKSTMRVMR